MSQDKLYAWEIHGEAVGKLILENFKSLISFKIQPTIHQPFPIEVMLQ